jgi:hypothetical protein
VRDKLLGTSVAIVLCWLAALRVHGFVELSRSYAVFEETELPFVPDLESSFQKAGHGGAIEGSRKIDALDSGMKSAEAICLSRLRNHRDQPSFCGSGKSLSYHYLVVAYANSGA